MFLVHSLLSPVYPRARQSGHVRVRKWKSGQVESLVILWVRLPPWTLDEANSEIGSVGVPEAFRFGKAADRVRFPDGPLNFGLMV